MVCPDMRIAGGTAGMPLEPKAGKVSASANGVLAPMFAHAGPSAQPPIDMSGNFSAHVSAESSSNISPDPSEVISEISELHNKSF